MIRTMTRVKRIPLAGAVLYLRDGVHPGVRGYRSCAYDGCTRDLVMGRVDEACGARAVRVVIALPQRRVNKVHRTPGQNSDHRGLWDGQWRCGNCNCRRRICLRGVWLYRPS